MTINTTKSRNYDLVVKLHENQINEPATRVIFDTTIFKRAKGYETTVAKVINYIKTEETLNQYKVKRRRPVVYFSVSSFDRFKRDRDVIQHSGLIIIDIDKKDNEDLDFSMLKSQLKQDENVYACFISPSGGLKVLFKTDLKEQSHHLAYYINICNYLKTNYPIVIDDSGSNIARACYLAYDSDAYLNNESLVFMVDDETIKLHIKKSNQHGSNQIINKDLDFISFDEHYDNILSLFKKIGIRVYPLQDKKGTEMGIESINEKGTEIGIANENVKRTEMGIYRDVFNSFRFKCLREEEEGVMSTSDTFLQLLILKNYSPCTLDFQTHLDDTFFKDKSVVSSFEIEGFNGINKVEVVLPKSAIKEGKRGKTLASITLKLIYNNPFVHPLYLFKQVKTINDYYSEDPNPKNPKPDDREVYQIVMSNYECYINGTLDFSKVFKRNQLNEPIKKHVFRRRNNSGLHEVEEALEIQLEGIKVYHNGRNELMHRKYHECIEMLKNGLKITNKRIADAMGLSERTIKRYQTESTKKEIKDYNKTIKATPIRVNNIKMSTIEEETIMIESCNTYNNEDLNQADLEVSFNNLFNSTIEKISNNEKMILYTEFMKEFNSLSAVNKQLILNNNKELPLDELWNIQDFKLQFKINILNNIQDIMCDLVA